MDSNPIEIFHQIRSIWLEGTAIMMWFYTDQHFSRSMHNYELQSLTETFIRGLIKVFFFLIRVQIFRKYFLLSPTVSRETMSRSSQDDSEFYIQLIFLMLFGPHFCYIYTFLQIYVSVCAALTESLWPLCSTKLHNLISFCMTHRVGFGLNRRDI